MASLQLVTPFFCFCFLYRHCCQWRLRSTASSRTSITSPNACSDCNTEDIRVKQISIGWQKKKITARLVGPNLIAHAAAAIAHIAPPKHEHSSKRWQYSWKEKSEVKNGGKH